MAARTVKRKSGCWEWTGYVKPSKSTQYGEIGVGPDVQNRNRKAIKVHRAAWILAFGEIPDGLCVCHHCDNPICVRPSHLFLGTAAANVRDMDCKGRRRSVSGNVRLTAAQVAEIRHRYEVGERAVVIAEEFGITRQYVVQLHRRLWRAA